MTILHNLAIAVVATTLAFAQTTASAQHGPAEKSAKPTKAWGVTWQPDLDTALAVARKQQKPVVWFRVLGELDGGC